MKPTVVMAMMIAAMTQMNKTVYLVSLKWTPERALSHTQYYL